MADIMVLATQAWLNDTYGNDSRFKRVSEDGMTGWETIYGLTRALQIELGIENTADNFGSTSQSLYAKAPLVRNDLKRDNRFAILQGALWCKGYNPGHYGIQQGTQERYHVARIFDSKVEQAYFELQEDAGMTTMHEEVTVNFIKVLLSMDTFKLLESYGGKQEIRQFQQYMNRRYESYIGIMPCDGVYGRNTNKALIYAIQAEEKMPIGTANGTFGPTTKRCCPTIPYMGVEYNYYGATYNSTQIASFTMLFNFGLYVNGYGAPNFLPTINIAAIQAFQQFYVLPMTGKADITTWLSVATSCGDVDRSAKACDCATILTEEKAQTLLNYGYEVVGRYLSGSANGISKALTPKEIKIIISAGLRFFPIYQTSANYADYFSYEKGVQDVIEAERCATTLRIPESTIIYFAVDFDAMDTHIKNKVIPHFEGIASAKSGKYRIGIYAARNVCSHVATEGLSVSSFVCDMSTAFSGNLGYRIPFNWAFDQFATVRIGSGDGFIEIDKNGYSGLDFGVDSVDYGRVINIPETIKGTVKEGNQEEREVILEPSANWFSYQGDVTAIDGDGNCIIVVGPKVLNPNYPDDGKIWISDFKLPVRIDIVLETKEDPKESITVKCITNKGGKAHTYNKYPDNHPTDLWVDAIGTFEVENGIFQTGIAYPYSNNAKNETPFALNHIDSSSIEFAGREIGFNPNNYRLLKIIVLDDEG